MVSGEFEGVLVLSNDLGVDLDLGGSKSGSGDELEVGVAEGNISANRSHSHVSDIDLPNQLAGEPKEGLLEVVVGLGTDVVVLEVLLAVESDVLGLHLTFL